MQPTSETQYSWTPGAELPALEPVADGLWSIAMGMPDRHIFYSLCYLIVDSDEKVHVIDPGWGSDENYERLLGALTHLGRSLADIGSIICTHFHPDHLGMAERVRDGSGAPILLHRVETKALHEMQTRSGLNYGSLEQLESWGVPEDARPELLALATAPSGMPTAVVDRELADNTQLDVRGWRLRVLHTAGHTRGHVCFVEPDRRLIFTGDHLLPTLFAGIGLGGPTPSNPMADYLQSLDALREFADYEVLPGHGYRFRGLIERCDASQAHHLRRSREVAAVLAANESATVWQVAERVTWSAGWKNLKGFYRISALSQTAMHVDFVRSKAGRDRLGGSSA